MQVLTEKGCLPQGGSLFCVCTRGGSRDDVVIRFTLYSRVYCHLCNDMLSALSALAIAEPHAIDVVDVDADEAL
ncbi:MAG TPA: glutaredoxin family protein, partial [Oxalicibacterium sp.]|nr:glutaredoxin family protein [Oxalicibacterium sp.]